MNAKVIARGGAEARKAVAGRMVFRGQRTEDGGQRTDDRGRMTEDSSRKIRVFIARQGIHINRKQQ
jgi:hypothetical protein